MTITCGSCHDSHGNSYYRNLLEVEAGTGVTYAKGVVDDTKDVNEMNPVDAPNTVADAYAAENIQLQPCRAALAAARMERFCVKCHGDIHTDAEAASGHFTKHPTAGHGRTWRNGPVSHVKALGTGATPWVSCVSCHKAHGSTHSFGLVYDDRLTTTIEDGTTIKDTCNNCMGWGPPSEDAYPGRQDRIVR